MGGKKKISDEIGSLSMCTDLSLDNVINDFLFSVSVARLATIESPEQRMFGPWDVRA